MRPRGIGTTLLRGMGVMAGPLVMAALLEMMGVMAALPLGIGRPGMTLGALPHRGSCDGKLEGESFFIF